MEPAGQSAKILIMPAAKTAAAPKAARTGRGAKPHVPSACTNCKKAHLACDLQRPCQRCVNSGKCDTCKDVQHKKRGRPRSKDKKQQSVVSGTKSPMETRMFQFSFAAPSGAPSDGASSQNTVSTPSSPKQTKTQKQTRTRPQTPTLTSSVPAAAAAAAQSVAPAVPAPTAHLFLTPGLLCLRLEEPSAGRELLGHSLLSLINRNLSDFVSPHDRQTVLAAFETLRAQLASRLEQRPSEYARSVLGHPPRAVDPNTFQALPLSRLLQRVCADISGNVRAHLRTASGAFDLFDIHVFVGAVSSPPLATAGVVLDEAYFVCRITRFDALRGFPSPPMLLPARNAASDGLPPAKRRNLESLRQSTSTDALYLLAEATDVRGGSVCDEQLTAVSSKQSTVFSSPRLSPSPSTALSPRQMMLPSLADMLKSLESAPDKPRFSPTLPSHCISP
ncbi:hypothetical protein FB639_001359 [Coemansia asiatica]|nr:hypothetical protein FB639_001359 [Coemansia asiatica]